MTVRKIQERKTKYHNISKLFVDIINPFSGIYAEKNLKFGHVFPADLL